MVNEEACTYPDEKRKVVPMSPSLPYSLHCRIRYAGAASASFIPEFGCIDYVKVAPKCWEHLKPSTYHRKLK